MNDVFENPGSGWTDGAGPEPDIVIASRVRLARNLSGLPLPHQGFNGADEQVFLKCRDMIDSFGGMKYNFFVMSELSDIDRQMLVEKHLISSELAVSPAWRAVIIREDESVSVMVNEEDHLRIQCLLPGLRMMEAWRIASQVDDELEKELKFAFDPAFGYLTACPTNVGTGLRVSVMLHLAALEATKQLPHIFNNLSRLGFVVRGMYGEGSKAYGSLYQISNQVTLGVSEEELIERLFQAVNKLIGDERTARAKLREAVAPEIFDDVWRSYALLKNARLLTKNELMERLSYLRSGINMGIINTLTAKDINELMIMGQTAYLQKNSPAPLNNEQMLWERASMVRKRLPLVLEDR